MNLTNMITGRPWALDGSTFAAMADASRLLRGQRFAIPTRERPRARQTGSVAVLPLFGILDNRPHALLAMLGGTALTEWREAMRDAAMFAKAIVIDVDSPGGATDGATEAAAEVRDLARRLPVVAIVNTLCSGTAYQIASGATEVYTVPSGLVGGLGVSAMHRDISGRLKQEGERVSLIAAGRYKTEGNPYEPLDAEARAELQRKADAAHASMLADIALGRGVTTATVAQRFGQGRTLRPEAAQAAGMVDGVLTRDGAIARATALAGGALAVRSRAARMAELDRVLGS